MQAYDEGLKPFLGIDQKQIDAIVSDIMMPRTSGLELVETLKGDPDTKAIPPKRRIRISAAASGDGARTGARWEGIM